MRTLFGRTQYKAPSRFLADMPPDVVRREGEGKARQGTFTSRFADEDAPPPYAGYGAPSTSRYEGFGGSRMARPETPGERVVDYDAFDDVPNDDAVRFRIGARVFHKRFGKGVVRRVEPGAPPVVEAHFPGFGPRKVRADFLTFE
jgi:hypothetical protein